MRIQFRLLTLIAATLLSGLMLGINTRTYEIPPPSIFYEGFIEGRGWPVCCQKTFNSFGRETSHVYGWQLALDVAAGLAIVLVSASLIQFIARRLSSRQKRGAAPKSPTPPPHTKPPTPPS